MPKSLAARRTGFSSSSVSSQTARRHSRIEPAQLMPVNSRTAPAMRPTVPAFWTRPSMSSWSEIPGTWSAILCWRSLCLSLPNVAATIAAATVSSGKSATKLVKVIAAASRVHFTRSSRSKDRHAWVAIRRASGGPTTGSFFSQSMFRLCPGQPTIHLPPGHGRHMS
ncbi:hypothetical protein SALBM311S_00407 [Streptomyces alboniger]